MASRSAGCWVELMAELTEVMLVGRSAAWWAANWVVHWELRRAAPRVCLLAALKADTKAGPSVFWKVGTMAALRAVRTGGWWAAVSVALTAWTMVALWADYWADLWAFL